MAEHATQFITAELQEWQAERTLDEIPRDRRVNYINTGMLGSRKGFNLQDTILFGNCTVNC
eukprot:9001571-Pyramimonas_sp.AAC.1